MPDHSAARQSGTNAVLAAVFQSDGDTLAICEAGFFFPTRVQAAGKQSMRPNAIRPKLKCHNTKWAHISHFTSSLFNPHTRWGDSLQHRKACGFCFIFFFNRFGQNLTQLCRSVQTYWKMDCEDCDAKGTQLSTVVAWTNGKPFMCGKNQISWHLSPPVRAEKYEGGREEQDVRDEN